MKNSIQDLMNHQFAMLETITDPNIKGEVLQEELSRSKAVVEIVGVTYRIVDIGMRMLQPHELYRAQGFPEWYIIDQDYRGVKYAKDKQVARCGNAVPPPFAEALVRANLPEMCVNREEQAA